MVRLDRQWARRTWAGSLLLAGAMACLAGCAAERAPTYAGGRAPSILGLGGAGEVGSLSLQAPPGRAVALLAPITGPNAERGAALVKAAQLALSEPGSPELDVRDTGGTAAGAAAAAQAAITAGAGLIIGPLTAAETAAAAGPARAAGVAVLAFTSDPNKAQPGIWTLGITPAQQAGRLVLAAAGQGKTRFAAVLPRGEFGNAMAAAFGQATAAAGAGAPTIVFHESGNAAIAQAMRDVSNYAGRRGLIDQQARAARARHDTEGRRLAADLARREVPPAPLDALLLADTGDRLAWLATFISYYDIGPPAVRVLGPALWAEPAARAGAAIPGAWFAAPDPAGRVGFEQAFAARFAAPPPGLADLAYDAASIARTLAQSTGFAPASLVRVEGFAGVDGPLLLLSDGSARRGLAVFEVRGAAAELIEPAPQLFAAPTS